MSKTVALIGNPNCGKTTIFNALTGAHQSVGNWAGVTVEKKSGFFEKGKEKIEVVDLPGIYSLSVVSSDSEDERITRDFLLFQKPDYVINIVDASNLERSLYMTLQLLEMGLDVLLVLNMTDVAKRLKIKIDVKALEACLNLPVIEMVASKTKGVEALKEALVQEKTFVSKPLKIAYDESIENCLNALLKEVSEAAKINGWNPRWFAVHFLDGDTDKKILQGVKDVELLERIRSDFSKTSSQEADTLIAHGRYDFISKVTKSFMKKAETFSQTLTESIDKIALGRFTGLPLFMFVMFVMFVWTISLGGLLIDPIAEFSELYLVEKLGVLLTSLNVADFVLLLLCDGVGQGLTTIATFIPPIGFLFLFLSVLEDSGYMARGAFVTDRLMRKLNLPGTAFVPMIVAFGCTVPAVMGTRILSSKKDRLMTLMMTPFMSCGARLPVYALFATAFFKTNGSLIVFLLYLLGVLMAILTGLLFKASVLKGQSSHLILEIPPYHLPILKNVLIKTWDKLKGFVLRAGVLIIPMVIVLNVLNLIDIRGHFVEETPEKSVLSSIGRSMTPIFKPMGISQENWPATVGLFTGVLAKEAIVGTLDTLYAGFEDLEKKEKAKELGDLEEGEGVAELGNVGDLEEGEFLPSTTRRLVQFFNGQIGAFSYLLFVLMYVPCLAAVSAIAKEFGLRWAVLTSFWTTGQAYLVSVLFYQSALLYQGGEGQSFWIMGVLGLEALIVLGFFVVGRQKQAFEEHGDSFLFRLDKCVSCATCARCSRCSSKQEETS